MIFKFQIFFHYKKHRQLFGLRDNELIVSPLKKRFYNFRIESLKLGCFDTKNCGLKDLATSIFEYNEHDKEYIQIWEIKFASAAVIESILYETLAVKL